ALEDAPSTIQHNGHTEPVRPFPALPSLDPTSSPNKATDLADSRRAFLQSSWLRREFQRSRREDRPAPGSRLRPDDRRSCRKHLRSLAPAPPPPPYRHGAVAHRKTTSRR